MIVGGQQQPLFLSEKVKGEGKPLSSILRLAKPTLQEFPVPLGSGPHDVAAANDGQFGTRLSYLAGWDG
jgi:streptogramin lyase